ncbi:flavodoxin family protein [Actinosynnema pretiosum]|uniref:Flavodoxin n=1 Tax=Actinosynnema pretiosum TaxID=42197 RepID=A0A290Z607_9PSEU|nr:flavodoxin [Actinosynnema pretiosum]ATE54467.1 flavodoxin [Actinosynnema pretiosum]
MARALVVYESMFGNAKLIAEAIARGLSIWRSTDVLEVGVAPDVLPSDLDLLVVGAPTHAFGLSRPGTRKAATQYQEQVLSSRRGMREWLAVVEQERIGVEAVAFDTGIRFAPGSAARVATLALRKLRFEVRYQPKSFDVVTAIGPLLDGEAERAEEWGRAIAEASFSRN